MPQNRLVPHIRANQPEGARGITIGNRLIEETDNVNTRGWSTEDMIRFVRRAFHEVYNMDPVERTAWIGGAATGATIGILRHGTSNPAGILEDTATGARTGRQIANDAGFTPETGRLTREFEVSARGAGTMPRIPQSSGNIATSGSVNAPINTGTLPRRPPTTNPRPNPMDNNEETPTTQQAVATGGFNAPSKETPVMMVNPSYGLQDTHTTILPIDFYLGYTTKTYGGAGASQLPRLSLRLNSPWDIIESTLGVPALNDPMTNAIVNARPPLTTDAWPATGTIGRFPETIDPTTAGGPIPAWREWWLQIYQAYTVLRTHWSITIKNTGTDAGGPCTLIKYLYEAAGPSDTTGLCPRDANIIDMDAWENIKEKRVYGRFSNNVGVQGPLDITTIEGSWHPGMIQRNVKNDGDVKTWTDITTAGQPPNYKELLTLFFAKDPLAGNGSAFDRGIIKVTLKYVVQFKDQQQILRWPRYQADPQQGNLTWPTMCIQNNQTARSSTAV
jgi:hypothetical protein